MRAATELMSVQFPDAISVADITTHAGMTPAAFYYHFNGKDAVLAEVVDSFALLWAAQVEERLAEVHEPDDLPEFVSQLLGWLETHERLATIYFVTSVAATEASETTRRDVRARLHARAIEAMGRVHDDPSGARSAVGGIALITLLEVVARSRMLLDESYRTLGPVRFRSAAASLARGLAGPA